MKFKERREEARYFETLRGSLFRNLAYAGIAATWALREYSKAPGSSSVWAIIFFAAYLLFDAAYIHVVASIERRELQEFTSRYISQKGKPPDDDDDVPISSSSIWFSVWLNEHKVYLLIFAYAFFIYSAVKQLHLCGS
jgi:hypothetical protein